MYNYAQLDQTTWELLLQQEPTKNKSSSAASPFCCFFQTHQNQHHPAPNALMATLKNGKQHTSAHLYIHTIPPFDLTCTDQSGKTALIYAAMQGFSNFISELIQSKKVENVATLKINHQDNDNMTALMHAAKNGHATTVALLLTTGADDTLMNNDNKSAHQLAEDSKYHKVLGVFDAFNKQQNELQL